MSVHGYEFGGKPTRSTLPTAGVRQSTVQSSDLTGGILIDTDAVDTTVDSRDGRRGGRRSSSVTGDGGGKVTEGEEVLALRTC